MARTVVIVTTSTVAHETGRRLALVGVTVAALVAGILAPIPTPFDDGRGTTTVAPAALDLPGEDV